MGRRNQHNSAEFDELVLSKVEEFLQHRSARDLSLRKVATLIDYAPSTLVSVYGNYANLLLRVNSRSLKSLNEQLSKVLGSRLENASQEIAREKLFELGLCYYEFAQQHPHRWQLIFELRMPGEEPLPDWIQSAIDFSFELLMLCLKRINPHKSESELRLASRVLWSSVHGITQLALGDKLFLNQHEDGPQMIRSMVDNYVTTWAQTHH